MPVELIIPPVGESISEALIGKWLKKPGDTVRKDEAVAELETDKVTVELPAPVSGTIARFTKNEGDKARVGEVIGFMEEGAVAGNGDGKPAAAPAAPAPRKAEEPRVMPAAKRELAQAGLSSADVKATGPGGRVLKEDVQRQVAAASASAPRPESPRPPASLPAVPIPPLPDTDIADRTEQLTPMTPIRKRIAERLVQAQHNAALLTTFNECDMSAVMALRSKYKEDFEKRHGVKLGFMSFFVKAVIEGLRAFPRVNSEIRGIAVSTERGLIVPVIRSAERRNFADIEKIINDFGARAKANKLKLDELEGGTFTITNGGVFGSLLSTPIINPPQSGVLGMHAIQERAVVVAGQVVARPMMYLALTYDHRIVDGRDAVLFLIAIKEALEYPGKILLDL